MTAALLVRCRLVGGNATRPEDGVAGMPRELISARIAAMDWLQVGFGLFLLLAAVNLRYQNRRIRRRIVRQAGDVERFDRRYLHSRFIRWANVGLPMLALLVIVTGLLGG